MNIETDTVFGVNGAITENHPCFMQFHQNPTIKGSISYVNPRYGYYDVNGILDNPEDPKYQCMANIRRMADGSVTQVLRDPSIVVKEPCTNFPKTQPNIYQETPLNTLQSAKVGVGRFETASTSMGQQMQQMKQRAMQQRAMEMREQKPKGQSAIPPQQQTQENFGNISKKRVKEGYCSVPKQYMLNEPKSQEMEGFCPGSSTKQFPLDRPEAEANLIVKEPFCGPQVFSEYDSFGINLRPNCMYSATGKLECDKPHIFNQDRKVSCRYY